MKNIVMILIVLVIGLTVVINMQPSEFKVARSTAINAPAPAVYEQINNFHNWEQWSPWAKLDPNAKTAYEGPASGVGAVFRWSGNDKVGEGSETITASRPDLVGIRLDFIKPFKGTSEVEFALQPQQGGQTLVTWSMAGHKDFIGKAMGLVMDCGKMMGDQFDQGLVNLKSAVEAGGR